LKRTRLSVCAKKLRHATFAGAQEAARAMGLPLRAYRCDKCRHYHLTSRRRAG
jgi:hypothetical protein